MASKTKIGNRALEFLGQGPVTSIDSSQPAAKALRRVYDESRRSILEEHPWSFAKKRASLPASGATPEWGYSRGVPVPSDYIRLIAIKEEPAFDIEADPTGTQWIVTNAAAPLDIIYIYDVEDTGRYPSSFVDAFAARLAFDVCEDIAQSNSKGETNWNRYQNYLLKAKTINGLQRQAVGFRAFSFIRSRQQGVSSFWPPLAGTGEPRE
jgi:hypothetical protein